MDLSELSSLPGDMSLAALENVVSSLGLMDKQDKIAHFFECQVNTPVFSERSFMIGNDLPSINFSIIHN